MSVDPPADQMLAAARTGSNRAWAALVQHLDPRARRLAHLVLGGHDVDRVLLGAYVRAYRARRKGPDDAVVFLLHHVWVACGHEIRRQERRGAPAPGRRPTPAGPPARLGPDPRGRAVAALRPEERAVWGLVEQEELPAEVVATALGVAPEVVGVVADRARTQVEDATVRGPEAEPNQDPGAPTDPGALEPEPAEAPFWAELGRRLRAEREALPAAPPPRLPAPGEPSPALTPAKAPPVAMQKRAPRRSRRSRPDLVEGLAEEAERQRVRRPWRSVVLRVAAVVLPLALVAGVVFVLYRAASTARSPVRGHTTASLAGDSLDRLASGSGWSATVELTVVAEDGTRSQASFAVTTTSDGSYRVEQASGGRLATYDARFGLVQDVVPGFGIRHDLGVAPGPPDPAPARTQLPTGEVALAARTLATETGTAPIEDELDGVEVWRLEGELEGGLGLAYAVRVSDLLPARITWTREGELVRELRFSEVDLNPAEVPFAQELPSGAPEATDQGFVSVPLGEVQGRIGMAPLTPNYLPEGFVTTGASVHEEGRIASLRYARGPAEIIVTLRPSPVEAGRPWDDPFDRGLEVVEAQTTTLGRGPFRDVEVQVVSGGPALPSVWGANGELAFTVSGDLSPDDLLEVARSLT